MRAGDVFFFNPFEVHAAKGGHEPVVYETLYPSEAYIAECIAEGDDGTGIAIQTDVLTRTPQTYELIEALAASPADDSGIDRALQTVLTTCAFTTGTPFFAPPSLALRACMLIKDNYAGPIRTDQLADRLQVHRSHLIRAFKDTIGITPQTYIRQMRVAKAFDLILAGLSLSEIAPTIGFCDQSHFTREFKKVFGVSPGVLSNNLGRRKRRTGIWR